MTDLDGPFPTVRAFRRMIIAVAVAGIIAAIFGGGMFFERDWRVRLFPRKSLNMMVLIDQTGVNGGQPSLQINMDGRALCWIGLGNRQTVAYLQEELNRLPQIGGPPATP